MIRALRSMITASRLDRGRPLTPARLLAVIRVLHLTLRYLWFI